MRKLVFNKKFLAAVGIVLAVGGCFFVKGRMNTKAADDSIFVQNMSVQYKQCEGTSKEILEEDIDEHISEEIMALEEKGHTYEIGEALSAKDSEFDKVIGLEIGADDYMTKPFSNRELQARVKAILRRTDLTIENQEAEAAPTEIVIGDLQILTDAFVVKKHGEELDLTHREFELLHHLATHIGQVMTREHLLETVWGYDYFGDVRTVDVTIRRLREKIEDIPSRPEYILTRRGVGYYMRNND